MHRLQEFDHIHRFAFGIADDHVRPGLLRDCYCVVTVLRVEYLIAILQKYLRQSGDAEDIVVNDQDLPGKLGMGGVGFR
jgi:hypothetical protein